MNHLASKCALPLIVIGLLAAWTRPASAQDAAALAKQANNSLREAQNHMFSGRLPQAEASLAAAETALTSLKAADPANAQIPMLESKCVKMRRDIEARKPKPADPAPAAGGATTAAPAGDALPSGAQFRLKDADRSLDKVDRILGGVAAADYKVEASRAALQEARDTLAEIEAMFGAKANPDAPEMKAVRDRMAEAEKKIADFQAGAAQAAAAGAQAKAAAEQWRARMEPYVMGPGRGEHNPEKYLGSGPTSDLTELARQRTLCAEAKALLAEFEQAGVTEKGDALAEAERQLRYAIRSFEESFAGHVERTLQGAEQRAEEIDAFLKRQEAAGAQAVLLEKDQLADLRRATDAAAGLAVVAGAGAERVSALQTKFADLEKRDAALRQARVEQTRMTADRYTGGDLAQLKQKAESLTREKLPGAAVLRATIISPDWKEESVIEATDTTHTALRHRTTRSVTAQVAAKAGDTVQLHTLYLGKDLQSGGSWGPLYGHIMFTDPMLEKNVQ